MQAYACDKRSRNHTYRRPRLKARPVTAPRLGVSKRSRKQASAARREAGGVNGSLSHAACGAAAMLNNLSIETCNSSILSPDKLQFSCQNRSKPLIVPTRIHIP